MKIWIFLLAIYAPIMMKAQLNVFGEPLQPCSVDPLTGFFRDGSCNTGDMDYGTHVICARMTNAFLNYSRRKGNDLITPRPEYNFPGLKAGDKWCLCALRWEVAFLAGVAPPVVLASTHQRALEFVSMADLRSHAVLAEADKSPSPKDN
jgi:uncharacterized protein (DUF2237 family)